MRIKLAGSTDAFIRSIPYYKRNRKIERKKQHLSTLYFVLIDFPSSRYDDKMFRNELAGLRSRVYNEPIQVSCAKREENNDLFISIGSFCHWYKIYKFEFERGKIR